MKNKSLMITLVCMIFLYGCETVNSAENEQPQWVAYFKSENVHAYVDLNVGRLDLAGTGLKSSSILIDYAQPDVEGTHSAIMKFALDCNHDMVQIESFTSYAQPFGQGDIVKSQSSPEVGFLPLNTFFNGNKIRALICKERMAAKVKPDL